MNGRKTYRRAYSPTMRLKICNEYMSGKAKAKDVAEKYHISRRTLEYWLSEYKVDYEALIDFYRFIMGELAANGFVKAAEYLRDYAVDILTESEASGGIKPPKCLNLNFDDILKTIAPAPPAGTDEVLAGLEIFNSLKAK